MTNEHEAMNGAKRAPEGCIDTRAEAALRKGGDKVSK